MKVEILNYDGWPAIEVGEGKYIDYVQKKIPKTNVGGGSQ